MDRKTSLTVAIIGAGAAGLAAARTLVDAGIEILVLEARARVGGRAWTLKGGPCPLDLGCGWLHSADRNPLGPIAAGMGLTIDRTPSSWGRQYGDLGFTSVEQAEFHATSASFYERLEHEAQKGSDRPAAELLDPGGRWNGLLGAIGTYVNGVEFDRLSIIDYARYADSGVNWRIREGYGTAIATYGRTIPVRLNCPVSLVDHGGASVSLVTPLGVLEADRVIVTTPPTMLTSGQLRFAPELPDKLAAAHGLPLGVANKLILEVTRPEAMPKNAHVIGKIDRVATASYGLRPLGRPLIEAYFGGELAKDLESEGLSAFSAFALEELAALFGANVLAALRPITSTAWFADAFSRGSYSHALPGHADDRAVLAAPVDDRIYFAGEACSRHDFSTAHGAYETGVAAALAIAGSRQGAKWKRAEPALRPLDFRKDDRT